MYCPVPSAYILLLPGPVQKIVVESLLFEAARVWWWSPFSHETNVF